MAELAPETCRGIERAVPFLTADVGIGSRVVLETTDSAITGCALQAAMTPMPCKAECHFDGLPTHVSPHCTHPKATQEN